MPLARVNSLLLLLFVLMLFSCGSRFVMGVCSIRLPRILLITRHRLFCMLCTVRHLLKVTCICRVKLLMTTGFTTESWCRSNTLLLDEFL